MEELIKSSLMNLANDIQFRVDKPSGADAYYTDGLSSGSFLKLHLHRREGEIIIYIFETGTYWSLGKLTQDEKSILDGWLETIRSKKIEQDKHRMKRIIKQNE